MLMPLRDSGRCNRTHSTLPSRSSSRVSGEKSSLMAPHPTRWEFGGRVARLLGREVDQAVAATDLLVQGAEDPVDEDSDDEDHDHEREKALGVRVDPVDVEQCTDRLLAERGREELAGEQAAPGERPP